MHLQALGSSTGYGRWIPILLELWVCDNHMPHAQRIGCNDTHDPGSPERSTVVPGAVRSARQLPHSLGHVIAKEEVANCLQPHQKNNFTETKQRGKLVRYLFRGTRSFVQLKLAAHRLVE